MGSAPAAEPAARPAGAARATSATGAHRGTRSHGTTGSSKWSGAGGTLRPACDWSCTGPRSRSWRPLAPCLVGRRLEADLEALRGRLAADARLAGIRLDLVHPGERCRIGRVFDVVAPRAKLDGGEDFPGVLGGLTRTGQGRTLALGRVAVVATISRRTVSALAVIDMAGPNAALSAFGAHTWWSRRGRRRA